MGIALLCQINMKTASTYSIQTGQLDANLDPQEDKKEQKSDFKHNLLIEDSVQCFDGAIVQKICQTNRGAIMLSGSDQIHQVNMTSIPIMHQTTIKQTDQTPAALELRDKFQLKPFI